jgi:type I restriction enzyme, S subunit
VTWSEQRVQEMADLINGFPFDSDDFSDDGDLPLVRIRDILGESFETFVSSKVVPDSATIHNGDVVIGMDGDFNVVHWSRGSAALNQRVCLLRSNGRAETRFLAYALPAHLQVINDLTYATTVKHLSSGQVRGIRMTAPEVKEQRAIADYLDRETARIDTLIEEQQRLIEMLRERRAAVLSAMFNAGPSTETTKVGRLLAARPSYGVLVPNYVDEAEGVPFVRVGDLLNLAPKRPMLAIAPEQSDEYSRTMIVGGEVLLGVVGKMGQAALAPQWLAGANVARAVAVLRCRDPAVAPLLCAWLGSISFLWQAELATSGDSIQPTLGMKDLARFDINLPINPNAATNLAGRLAKIDALIAETGRFIELSKERRSALITAAVTGQIDVREMA